MVTWKTRADWNALPARPGTPRPLAELVGITDHDAPGVQRSNDPAYYAAQVAEIQRYYMSGASGQGLYVDIPYNALYDPLGNIWPGRDNRIVGAHATSSDNKANRITLGLCYLGNGDQPLTPAAAAARRAYFYVVQFGVLHAPVWHVTHREWVSEGGIVTHCAGDWLQGHQAP